MAPDRFCPRCDAPTVSFFSGCLFCGPQLTADERRALAEVRAFEMRVPKGAS